MGYYNDWTDPKNDLATKKTELQHILQHLRENFNNPNKTPSPITDIYPVEFQSLLGGLELFYAEATATQQDIIKNRATTSVITDILIECGHALMSKNKSWKEAAIASYKNNSYTNLVRYIALAHIFIVRENNTQKMAEFNMIISHIAPTIDLPSILNVEQDTMDNIGNNLDRLMARAQYLKQVREKN